MEEPSKPAAVVVEVALRLSVMPSGALEAQVLHRGRDGSSVVRTWHPKHRAISAPELEDIVSVLGEQVVSCFLITPGVQLILHD